jgi:hypothetical protein
MGAVIQELFCCGRSRFVVRDKRSHRPSVADIDPRFLKALETEEAVPRLTICIGRIRERTILPKHVLYDIFPRHVADAASLGRHVGISC